MRRKSFSKLSCENLPAEGVVFENPGVPLPLSPLQSIHDRGTFTKLPKGEADMAF